MLSEYDSFILHTQPKRPALCCVQGTVKARSKRAVLAQCESTDLRPDKKRKTHLWANVPEVSGCNARHSKKTGKKRAVDACFEKNRQQQCNAHG
jgi:hypothetical protein